LTGLGGSLLVPAWAQPAPPGEAQAALPSQLRSLLPLPEPTLLDGNRARPSDTDGQVVVLYWWASGCPFCAQRSPWMETFWLAHKARGLRVTGLSIDRKAEDASACLSKKGYTFPAGLVTPAVARMLPKPKGLPVTTVRGRDGRALAAETGQLFPEDIEQFARFL
jgi:hypothetical protein